mgnify:CR=1 FL=1
MSSIHEIAKIAAPPTGQGNNTEGDSKFKMLRSDDFDDVDADSYKMLPDSDEDGQLEGSGGGLLDH